MFWNGLDALVVLDGSCSTIEVASALDVFFAVRVTADAAPTLYCAVEGDHALVTAVFTVTGTVTVTFCVLSTRSASSAVTYAGLGTAIPFAPKSGESPAGTDMVTCTV